MSSADDNLAAKATQGLDAFPEARVVVAPDLVLVDSGLPCDTFNIVCRARFTSATARMRVAEAIAFFRVTGHPWSWWLMPGYTPAELPDVLAGAGLAPTESEVAMSMGLGAPTPAEPVAGLDIRRVTTAADLEAFATLSAANWDPPDRHVRRFYRTAGSRFLAPDSPRQLFLGVLEGQPVATAEFAGSGSAAGLYGISTRSDCRRRGIGTAMTSTALNAARAAGYHRAVLQAAPDGVGIYTRLGFAAEGEIVEYKLVAGLSAAGR